MSINPKSLKEILKLKFDDFFYYFQNDKPYKVSTKKITDYITDNVLGVLPPILDKHSQITLDDGTNPHGTTKSDVGLGNVDNTSDVNKPISSATALEFVNVYNELSTKANNYVDIASIISGYTLTATDAGKLITNSGVNVRSLNIPSGLALPNNVVFVKGRVSITPASGVVVELPDGTTITNSAQFACLANTQYVLHRKEFGGDEWILLALGSAKNLGNSNLEITDATRTVEMGTGSRILKFLSNAVEKIIFNTASGSPTLQANKSGNGAAIRANKTSGTGSALEIVGGTTDFGNNKGINLADPANPQDAVTLAYYTANMYGGKRYTLIKPNGTKEFYDTLTQVRSNWADGDNLHQFGNETLAITNTTTISGYLCWSELPAISWNGNGHSVLFNVTGTSAFAVNANKNINFFDLRLTYNCADNSTSNGLIKSPTTSFLNGNGSTTLAQNVTVSNANHLTAVGLIGNFDNFNITSLHDKTWQVPGFCNGTFTNCNIRNVYTNRAATFIGCNFNEFVANLFSATTIIFDNCTLVNSIDALLTSNQGTVTITNCNMRFNVNSGIIMNATVVMNNSTINNVGNGLMFAAYSGSNNIVRTTGSGGFANTASVVVDYGSIFESTGGWNFRFTGSGSFFERTKFINNGTGGSLNTDVSGTGLKASFVDCIFFCAGTNNVGAVSDTYSFVGCTFNRTNFAFMYAGTQQQLLDNDPKRLTNVIDSRGNKGHGCRSPYPPMTTTERNSLTGVSKGFTIENTTTNFLQVYNGSTWKDLLDLT